LVSAEKQSGDIIKQRQSLRFRWVLWSIPPPAHASVFPAPTSLRIEPYGFNHSCTNVVALSKIDNEVLLQFDKTARWLAELC
jgi:hypothetical protein